MKTGRTHGLPRTYDGKQRRRALKAFMAERGLSGRKLSGAAGLSPSAVAQFLSGRTVALADDTYEHLAQGATELLGVPVTAAQLRGEEGTDRVNPLARLRALSASGKLDHWHTCGDNAAEIGEALRLIPQVLEQLDAFVAELRKVEKW